MRPLLIGLAVAGAATALATPALSAVTFDYAYIGTNSYASASNPPGSSSSSSSGYDEALALPLSPLLAESNAAAIVTKSGTTQASSNAEAAATATFASPSSGVVSFQSATNAFVGDGAPNGFADAYNYAQFQYIFSVTTASVLEVDYDLSSIDLYDDFNYISLYDYTTGIWQQYYPNDNSAGSLSPISLSNAGQYQLYISDYYSYYGDYVSQSGPGSLSGFRNDTYAFAISSAVPEPAAWATMIFGFFGLGAAMRTARRRERPLQFA